MSLNIFRPQVLSRHDCMKSAGSAFVHYTSAEAAFEILKNGQLWMRKSGVMNDFMEVEYGLRCLRFAYHSEDVGLPFKGIIDRIYPELGTEIADSIDSNMASIRNDTYIASFSEHCAAENEFGRLSMWRAYGAGSGVAIVVNPDLVIVEHEAPSVRVTPVTYATPAQFKKTFLDIAQNMEKKENFLRSLGREGVKFQFFDMFRFVILTTKHPGFGEELEWRLVHTPAIDPAGPLLQEVKTVAGVPQPLCVFNFTKKSSEELADPTVPKLIQRIIIGPTKHPAVIREAFVRMLIEHGLPAADAGTKVVCSDIPLRQ